MAHAALRRRPGAVPFHFISLRNEVREGMNEFTPRGETVRWWPPTPLPTQQKSPLSRRKRSIEKFSSNQPRKKVDPGVQPPVGNHPAAQVAFNIPPLQWFIWEYPPAKHDAWHTRAGRTNKTKRASETEGKTKLNSILMSRKSTQNLKSRPSPSLRPCCNLRVDANGQR